PSTRGRRKPLAFMHPLDRDPWSRSWAAWAQGGGGGGGHYPVTESTAWPPSRDDEVSGAGSSPVLGGVNLLSSNFSFPELFTRKVEEQWQRPEGPPRPTAATRTAYHHQQAWGSEKEVRPGPHTQLRGNKLALKTGRADKTKDEVLTRSGEAWAKCTAEAIKCEVHRCTSVATRNPPAIQET
uniref:Uncharacterized protein n=1 Tax=Bos taurus TaxID=9913 RepID=A0A3Q1LZ38_BOVIN